MLNIAMLAGPGCREVEESPPAIERQSGKSDLEFGAERAAAADDLVRKLLGDGRYALLLRPQIAQSLTPTQRDAALAALEEEMSEVPEGEVEVQLWTSGLKPNEMPAVLTRRLPVDRFFLDRHTVTNQQFQRFVSAGGYRQESLWHPSVWARVSEFTDSAGELGPRQWTRGEFPSGKSHHPVVGVSWFEADAYARWAGKRLACDGEWVKAASWPAMAAGSVAVGRRYPWGELMDSSRANLWFSETEGTVPVDEFPAGASAGGVLQLVGNVWEWTSSEFQLWIDEMQATLDEPMMSIRGGAFDTYFERNAGCQSQSGENPLARRDNIGIRCALGACDVLLASGTP